MRTDEELLAALNEKDRGAWREFLDRYERLIYSVPRRYGLSPEQTADVFQETLLALLGGLSRLRDLRALPRWLTQTAYRLSRDRARADRRAAVQEDGFWATVPDASPRFEDELEKMEATARLHQGMARLSDRCRELLEALFLADEAPSYEDLARRMGTPIGSLGPTRRRCLESLLEILGGDPAAGARIKPEPSTTFAKRRRAGRSGPRSPS